MILQILLWLGVVFGGLWVVARLIRGVARHGMGAEESRRKIASELFLLLSVLFFGILLLALNKHIADAVSWQTILLATTVCAGIIAYRYRSIATLLYAVVGLPVWWGTLAATWVDRLDVAPFGLFTGIVVYSLCLYVVGRIHAGYEGYRDFSLLYTIVGTVYFSGALFFLSTQQGLELFDELGRGNILFISWQMTFSLVVLVALFAGALWYALDTKSVQRFEWVPICFAAVLFVVLACVPVTGLFLQYSTKIGADAAVIQTQRAWPTRQGLSTLGIVWAAVWNLVSLGELLGLILIGYRRIEGWMINLGAFFLFLFIAVKYFDWFFTFLDRSLFFIIAGVLLFLVGWGMERGRKYVLKNAQEAQKGAS